MALVLLYICGSLNRFSKAHGSDLAPCDVALGRQSQKGPFTLFGATVLAKLPQSVRELSPNVARFVEAAFLHPVLSSQAVKVVALVRVDGRMELKTFTAQSVKGILPANNEKVIMTTKDKM